MNPWVDFLVTVAVRLVCGFILGAIASCLRGFRIYMHGLANGESPVVRLLIWGGVVAVICLSTSPRDSLTWVKG